MYIGISESVFADWRNNFMEDAEYKRLINEMIENIDNEEILIKIYTFIMAWTE